MLWVYGVVVGDETRIPSKRRTPPLEKNSRDTTHHPSGAVNRLTMKSSTAATVRVTSKTVPLHLSLNSSKANAERWL